MRIADGAAAAELGESLEERGDSLLTNMRVVNAGEDPVFQNGSATDGENDSVYRRSIIALQAPEHAVDIVCMHCLRQF